ncbi:hypothetical protein CLU88_0323 [Acidovorax sp. 56]|nr:hypothetical protein CLU88_0323 [Acidovorax sp. 56]
MVQRTNRVQACAMPQVHNRHTPSSQIMLQRFIYKREKLSNK